MKEEIVQDRQDKISKICDSIDKINSMYSNLNTIILEQADTINHVETNIDSTIKNTSYIIYIYIYIL